MIEIYVLLIISIVLNVLLGVLLFDARNSCKLWEKLYEQKERQYWYDKYKNLGDNYKNLYRR